MNLNPQIAKRIDRAGGRQERHGTCVICGKPFDDCPHDMQQIQDALLLRRLEKIAAL